MKKLLVITIVSLFMCIGFFGQAHAFTFPFTNIWDPSPDVYLSKGTANETYTFSHILSGFNPLTDIISNASIVLAFYDDTTADEGGSQEPESVKYTLDNIFTSGSQVLTNLGWQVTATVNTTYLQTDGKLDVILAAQKGDFYFNKSTLSGTGTSQQTVPEPATMSLFGLGLVGLLGLRRKK